MERAPVITLASQARYNRKKGINMPALTDNGKPVLTSVWVPSTKQLKEYAKDPFLSAVTFRGRTFPHVIRNLVLLYSEPDQWVYDPMMGSGTTAYVTVQLGRKVAGSDLNPDNVKSFQERWNMYALERGPCPSMVHKNASNLDHLPDHSVDLLIMSFPWFDEWKFAESKGTQSMENNKSLKVYLEQALLIYRECKRVVKPGGKICNILGNAYHQGILYPVCQEMFGVIKQAGLEFHYQFWNLRTRFDLLEEPWNRSGLDTKALKADKGYAWDVHEDIIIAKVPEVEVVGE